MCAPEDSDRRHWLYEIDRIKIDEGITTEQEWKDNFKLFCKIFSRMNHKVLELDPRNIKERAMANIINEIKVLKQLMKNDKKDKNLMNEEIKKLL
jgi:hypothetical protein